MNNVKKTIILIVLSLSACVGTGSSTQTSVKTADPSSVQEHVPQPVGRDSLHIRQDDLRTRRDFSIVSDIPKGSVSIRCKGEFWLSIVPAEVRDTKAYMKKHIDAYIGSVTRRLPKSESARYTVIVIILNPATNRWEPLYSEQIGNPVSQ
ncbi:MAG: hypothetical protein WCJ25_00370 [Candidatus Moraniibacteriota bacterium]